MPRRLLKPNRLGYRGAILLCFGVVFFLTGLPILLSVLHVYNPIDNPATIGLPFWAVGFMVAGVLSVVSAFRRDPALDKLGFAALSAVGWSWVGYCVLLWILRWTVWPHVGTIPWESIVGNAALMTMVWVISGWDEPTEPLNLKRRVP